MERQIRQVVRWHPLADSEALAGAATDRIRAAARRSIEARGQFRVVLAGGSTPRAAYRELAECTEDWAHWEIWFGDERCLPVGANERNDQMARDAWLDRVAIPFNQVHPIPAEKGPQAGARQYADQLRSVGDFDLVLLGLGEDGHTASLFPGKDWGTEAHAPDALAVEGAPKPPPQRVSLSAHRLAQTRELVFLVAGEAKRDAIDAWRAGAELPAAAIAPGAGVDVLLAVPGLAP